MLLHDADLVIVDVEVLVPVVEDLAQSVQFLVDPQNIGRTGGGGQADQLPVEPGDPVRGQAQVH